MFLKVMVVVDLLESCQEFNAALILESHGGEPFWWHFLYPAEFPSSMALSAVTKWFRLSTSELKLTRQYVLHFNDFYNVGLKSLCFITFQYINNLSHWSPDTFILVLLSIITFPEARRLSMEHPIKIGDLVLFINLALP